MISELLIEKDINHNSSRNHLVNICLGLLSAFGQGRPDPSSLGPETGPGSDRFRRKRNTATASGALAVRMRQGVALQMGPGASRYFQDTLPQKAAHRSVR